MAETQQPDSSPGRAADETELTEQPPAVVPNEQMQRRFAGGPLTASAVLVLIDGRMYKREGTCWYRLDDQPRTSIRDFIDGQG